LGHTIEVLVFMYFQNALTGIHTMLCIMAFLLFVIVIIHFAYCCAAKCCVSSSGQVVFGSMCC